MTPSIALAAPWPVAAEDAVAFAVRARSGVVVPTVTATLAGLLLLVPLLTTSWNVKVPGLEGAVNVGCTAVLLDNVTAVPPVCVHWYVSVLPFGSLLPEPFSVTVAPGCTVWFDPALATGVVDGVTRYWRCSQSG